MAVGPRASTFALVAAALETSAVGSLELHQPLASLKEVIEENATIEQKPELLCFGLLERFDVGSIAALVAPRAVDIQEASERARREFSLAAQVGRLGSQPAKTPRGTGN